METSCSSNSDGEHSVEGAGKSGISVHWWPGVMPVFYNQFTVHGSVFTESNL